MTSIGLITIMVQSVSVANRWLHQKTVSMMFYHTDRFCVYTRREQDKMEQCMCACMQISKE